MEQGLLQPSTLIFLLFICKALPFKNIMSLLKKKIKMTTKVTDYLRLQKRTYVWPSKMIIEICKWKHRNMETSQYLMYQEQLVILIVLNFQEVWKKTELYLPVTCSLMPSRQTHTGTVFVQLWTFSFYLRKSFWCWFMHRIPTRHSQFRWQASPFPQFPISQHKSPFMALCESS